MVEHPLSHALESEGFVSLAVEELAKVLVVHARLRVVGPSRTHGVEVLVVPEDSLQPTLLVL